MKTIQVNVSRYNPETDTAPVLQCFNDIAYDDNDSVLDILLKLKEEYDSSITFRYSCKCTICGSCAMRINDEARHACVTKMRDLDTTAPLTIEALKNFPVIKDLVVDLQPMIDTLRSVSPWIVADQKNVPEKEYLIKPEAITDTLQLLDKCTICGICHSDSSAIAEDARVITPIAMVKTRKLMLDPRDNLREERVKQLAELGLLKHSDEWNTTCPKGIDLASDVTLPLKQHG